MENFRANSLKAQLLCSILIYSQVPTKGSLIKGNLPDLTTLLEFVQTFITPYLKPGAFNAEPTFRALKESSVENVIQKKIAELKPLLQDYDVETKTKDEENDNLTLEGNDETTIVEFVPNNNKHKHLRKKEEKRIPDPLRAKINNYKKIRREIKAALMKENVTKDTRNLVTNTLDGIMARLLSNKCLWKSTPDNELSKSQNRVHNTISIASKWNKQWDKLKKQYLIYAKHQPDSFQGTKLFLFFEQFHEFLAHIVKDLEVMADKYKIICKVVSNNGQEILFENDVGLRQGTPKDNNMKTKVKCEYFKICSQELSKFMTDFYIALNDTAVSTLRNYASMYVRDVNNEDSQEKDDVASVITNLSLVAEDKTIKIFKRTTGDFQLNHVKDEKANIKALKSYIKNTIRDTITLIKMDLDTGLESLRVRLQQNIKKDLIVNIDVDLGNLERDLKSRICSVFSVCNGKFAGRKFMESDEHSHYTNRNNVYVKVQLSLDDELKDSLALKKSSDLINPLLKAAARDLKSQKTIRYRYKPTMMYRRNKEFDKYAMINVTRTTLNDSTTLSTTAIITTTITTSTTESTTKMDTPINETQNFV
ncbi:uncharacterized protein LOC114355394 [Ostrinia furnacalis]|uniref:uncharacterized protein LOC114355394 n=1 Tax=Ostrinia furnacalis TaxID=93504 RepID=UPI001038AB55|nr:uncharacterized protein LOC114355394 [Ostrinia furnacalis]